MSFFGFVLINLTIQERCWNSLEPRLNSGGVRAFVVHQAAL